MDVEQLKQKIREVPDFPKPGINFYDLTTLFRDREGLRQSVEQMAEPYRADPPDAIVGVEARGFVLGSALAYELGCGFVLVRKPGKLPAGTVSEEFRLEYGSDRIEMHADALEAGQRVLVVDDLLATGGTAAAAGRLVDRTGARLTGYAFLVELDFLEGRKKLGSTPVFSVLRYA
jgi:adenine phosphoribosyltransferase